MNRRSFIYKSGAALALPFIPNFSLDTESDPEKLLQEELPVNFTRDGLDLQPSIYSQLLKILSSKKDFKTDSYGLNGMIHEFEKKAAKALGKENAVYMPTGTLANHIALRNHCKIDKRAIVQYDSHINRDSGDCVSNLSGINLITLGKNKVIFDINELKESIFDSVSGKVKTKIGAISLETPVRRKNLERIPLSKIKEIVTLARENKIPTHLDGARLFIDAAFSGNKINEYTSLFDTVYLSLYKSFNSIGGAILAGTNEFIKDLHHQRRMFGGAMPSSWHQIAVADYFFDNYEDRYRNTLKQFENLRSLLIASGKFKIKDLNNGSNIKKLVPENLNKAKVLQKQLADQKIFLPNWNNNEKCFYIKVNDSILYTNVNKVAKSLINNG